MKNGYKILTTLTKTLNESNSLIAEFLKEGKDNFSNNEIHINIAIGLISEVKEIVEDLDEDIFMLNRNLHDILAPIINYSKNLFNDYKIVNAYKLYDALTIDIQKLKEYLNKIEEN